jgi:hypothetical protein
MAMITIVRTHKRVEASVLIPGITKLGSLGGMKALIIQKIIAIIKLVTNRGSLRRISSPFTFILPAPQPGMENQIPSNRARRQYKSIIAFFYECSYILSEL